MKAQASLEQLVVIAIGLALVAFTFYIAVNYSSDSTRISQAKDTVERLAASADHVYALGPNSKEYVTVYLPDDLTAASISGRNIILTMPTTGGTTDVYATSKAELIGAFPHYRGKQKVLVEYLLSGKVRIGEAGLVCQPSALTRTFNAGDSGTDTIVVANTADYNITGINASITGTSIAAIGSPSSDHLASGENGSLSVSYSVPAGQASGTYGASVTVEAGNGGACTTQVTVNVNGVVTCPNMCASEGYLTGTCREAEQSCAASGEDYHIENDGACAEPAPHCCCWPSTDELGPLAVNLTLAPGNATTTDNITISATCTDLGRGNLFIKSAEIQLDGGNASPMSPASGSFFSAVVQGVKKDYGPLMGGQHIAIVSCTDTANKTGPISYFYFTISESDTLGPIVTSIVHSDPAPTTLADITENATATDAYTGSANITACWMKIDGLDWYAAIPTDGAFEGVSESFSYHVGRLTSGMHVIYARCRDSKGNLGGIYNDTFGVSDGDIALVLDTSGSMAWPSVNESNNTSVSTTSATFALVKNLSVNVNGSGVANLSVQIRSSGSTCTAYYEARIGNDTIASGSRTSGTYATLTTQDINVSGYVAPFTINLYMRRNNAGCTAYNLNFYLWQYPSKIDSVQEAAGSFVDITDNSSRMTLVSFASSATLRKQLMGLGSAANKTEMKNAINALTAVGSTCLECGLDTGVTELISIRGRYPEAVRVMVFMTDGVDTTGSNPIAGAVYARQNDVKVYTIGYGSDADVTNLVNIALLTNGKYYYAPDAATLLYIFQHIGQ
ncbi:MAG: vWA domain-containing protein [Candidatus Micrarchaeia archaeon]